MSQIIFSYENSLISSEEIECTAEKLLEEIENMKHAVSTFYEDDRASLYLSSFQQPE